jgi:hypothetical protein
VLCYSLRYPCPWCGPLSGPVWAVPMFRVASAYFAVVYFLKTNPGCSGYSERPHVQCRHAFGSPHSVQLCSSPLYTNAYTLYVCAFSETSNQRKFEQYNKLEPHYCTEHNKPVWWRHLTVGFMPVWGMFYMQPADSAQTGGSVTPLWIRQFLFYFWHTSSG